MQRYGQLLSCRWHFTLTKFVTQLNSRAYFFYCVAKDLLYFEINSSLAHLTAFPISIKVSDVNDDVRRAAVESIGFILFR